jgi:alanine racemase
MTGVETPTLRASVSVTDTLFHRPCWAEVDLEAFRANWRLLKSLLPAKNSILAVVKANAYGHGIIPLSKEAVALGTAYLGVSSLEEGIALRKAGIAAPILVLGSLFPFENFPILLECQLTPTIASLVTAEALSALAQSRKQAIRVHVEVDTGMGRTGISPATALELLQAVARLPGLDLEGLYTHLASSDVDPEFTAAQVKTFEHVVTAAAAASIHPRWIHWGNSAALLRDPQCQPTLARPGLALYGVPPFVDVPQHDALQPVLSWKTRIIFLKTLPEGSSVSYARTWTAKRPSRIATLAVGYADGLPRIVSHRGHVLIQGHRAPLVGRVTMDMTMVDVTDIPECAVGDEAVLIGRQGDERLSATDLAGWAETNAYEILCGIDARVPRVILHG